MAATTGLRMVRGDTLQFDVRLSEIDSSSITSLYFTVKKKAKDTGWIVQKSLDNGITSTGEAQYRVRVAPEDTENVDAGKYVFDLQVGIGNDIYTPLIGTVDIVQDVTF